MAYSSVRVQFEIGHDASVRNKRTPEGFTHDWQVFVRGADNTDIQCFVDKVVFHLHETFQKPKRVVKEPPYAVKECGYAGFVLPIDVYLKNKEEPKKITFQYDLQLQSSGPPISKVLREPRVFQNPSEDFRRKLIRGGGVGVDAPPEDGKRKAEDQKPVLPKKHKPDLPLSNSFADLFGTPIQRVNLEPKKVVVEPQKKVEPEKKKISKTVKEEKDFNRDREKEKLKERDKIKEKSKKQSSPVPIKVKEEPKKTEDKEKKREEAVKVEKDRKDKYKEKEAEKTHKKEKKDKKDDVVKERVSVPEKAPVLSELDDTSRDRSDKEKHKHKHKKKEKDRSRDKDKHKHKEKDSKDRSIDKSKRKDEERVEKRVAHSLSPSPPPKHRDKRRKGPLGALFNELSDAALSEDEDPPPPARSYKYPPTEKLKHSKDEKSRKDKTPKKRADIEAKRPKLEKRDRSDSSERERERERERGREREREAETKRLREEQERREREEEEERRLRREEEERKIKEKEEEERRAREKEEAERKAREKEKEEELARKEKEIAAAAKALAKKQKESRKRTREKIKNQEEVNLARNVPTEDLTDEYLIQLRELRRRIMSLKDNTELQKLVQLITASGKFKVTDNSFDFDLCTLDSNTIRRLQDFFADST